MEQRITIILGAGAMIDSTAVSTKTLTEKVINNCKKYKINDSNDTSLVDAICNNFLQIYNKEISPLLKKCSKMDKLTSIISFEDIYHVLELLPNYLNSHGYKSNESAFQIFSILNQEFKNLKPQNIYGAANEIISTINNEIYSYDSEFTDKGKNFSRFFQEIAQNTNLKFDIFNLNYDTWVEQTLGNYNDGFVEIPNYENKMKRFDISEYLKSDNRHTISHLHGQICFEYPEFSPKDINTYAFQESHNTLYKYVDFSTAKSYRERSIRSSDHTQSGENLFRTNIVTGLMKTDKLLWNPLIMYHNKLANSLISNKRLILVGYGFSDLYINNLLLQYNAIHYNKRKIIMIDYISDENWQPQIEHPFDPSEKAVFTNLMFKDDFWCRRHPFAPKKPVYYSKDKMACIFKNGFNDVINNHLSDVIEFIF